MASNQNFANSGDFEFDHQKSERNFLKHGIRLSESIAIWQDEFRIEGPGISVQEDRWLSVGEIAGTLWTVCFTYRRDKIRIIGCRRARREERHVYQAAK